MRRGGGRRRKLWGMSLLRQVGSLASRGRLSPARWHSGAAALCFVAVFSTVTSADAGASQVRCQPYQPSRPLCFAELGSRTAVHQNRSVRFVLPRRCDKVRFMRSGASSTNVQAYRYRRTPELGSFTLARDGNYLPLRTDRAPRVARLRIDVRYTGRVLEYRNRSAFGVSVDFTIRCR